MRHGTATRGSDPRLSLPKGVATWSLPSSFSHQPKEQVELWEQGWLRHCYGNAGVAALLFRFNNNQTFAGGEQACLHPLLIPILSLPTERFLRFVFSLTLVLEQLSFRRPRAWGLSRRRLVPLTFVTLHPDLVCATESLFERGYLVPPSRTAPASKHYAELFVTLH